MNLEEFTRVGVAAQTAMDKIISDWTTKRADALAPITVRTRSYGDTNLARTNLGDQASCTSSASIAALRAAAKSFAKRCGLYHVEAPKEQDLVAVSECDGIWKVSVRSEEKGGKL